LKIWLQLTADHLSSFRCCYCWCYCCCRGVGLKFDLQFIRNIKMKYKISKSRSRNDKLGFLLLGSILFSISLHLAWRGGVRAPLTRALFFSGILLMYIK